MLERNVLVLTLSLAVGTFGNSLWVFFLPLHLQRLGASPAHIGIGYVVMQVTGLVASIPAGRLADRQGRKPVLVGGSFLHVVAIGILLGAGSWEVAFLGMGLRGVAAAGVAASVRTMLLESASAEKRARAEGTFKTVAAPAAAFAPLLASSLFADLREGLLLGFVFALIAAAIRWVGVRETLERGIASAVLPRHGLTLGLSGTPPSVLLLLAAGSATAAGGAITDFLVPLYGADILRLRPTELGYMFSGYLGLVAVTAAIYGRLSDRHGHGRMLLLSWSAVAVLLLLFAVAPSPLVAIISYMLWATLADISHAPYGALLVALTTSGNRAVFMGTSATLTGLAALPAPAIGGLLYQSWVLAPFLVNTLLILIALPMLLTLQSKVKRQAPSNESP